MCKSGLATINRSLAQARTVSCITIVLVWLGGFHVGAAGTLAVVILVALINTLGLTELVGDALGSRKQKEAETNAKIVHLLKHALDETKNCQNEQQRVEFHIALACVMPARETQGTNNGWIARICERLELKRGKRSQKNMRLIRQWTFVLNLTRTWNYNSSHSKWEIGCFRMKICASSIC